MDKKLKLNKEEEADMKEKERKLIERERVIEGAEKVLRQNTMDVELREKRVKQIAEKIRRRRRRSAGLTF